MPNEKDIFDFRERLEAEGEDLVRENLMMVIYGDENAWQNKRARLFLAEKKRGRERALRKLEDAHRSGLMDVAKRGTKWSGWTAVFTGLIAFFTLLLFVIALLVALGVI